MVNKDNENSTEAVSTELKSLSSQENNSAMLPVNTLDESTGEQQSTQKDNNPMDSADNNQVAIVQTAEEHEQEGDDDEFIRITAAHQMLTEAQTYEEQKCYPAALQLYRICVDLLLEELMFTEGTDQSRVYLREKCTAIMDRIDLLKTMLDPIPPLSSTSSTVTETTINDETTNPPTDELNSLHLS